MPSAVAIAPACPTATAVAGVARLIARAGLVEAFGHVSARDGEEMLITSTTPMGAADAEAIHRIPLAPAAAPGDSSLGVPLEWPLHAAIYRARADIGAICRTHSVAAVRFGVRGESPPLLHGLGGLSGEVVAAESIQLVTAEPAADLLAAALGGADCALVRGNGAIATGLDLAEAAVRAWFLEERCSLALAAGSDGVPLRDGESLERSTWYEAEAARAWNWLQWRFGGVPAGSPGKGDHGASAPESETR